MKTQKAPIYELNLPRYDVPRTLLGEDYKAIGSKTSSTHRNNQNNLKIKSIIKKNL